MNFLPNGSIFGMRSRFFFLKCERRIFLIIFLISLQLDITLCYPCWNAQVCIVFSGTFGSLVIRFYISWHPWLMSLNDGKMERNGSCTMGDIAKIQFLLKHNRCWMDPLKSWRNLSLFPPYDHSGRIHLQNHLRKNPLLAIDIVTNDTQIL